MNGYRLQHSGAIVTVLEMYWRGVHFNVQLAFLCAYLESNLDKNTKIAGHIQVGDIYLQLPRGNPISQRDHSFLEVNEQFELPAMTSQHQDKFT